MAKCNGCQNGMTVNRALLPVKATYFFLLAAVAFLYPYILVFMKHLGLTPTETSIIHTVTTAVSALARIVVGAIADAFNKHSVAMTICSVVCAVFHMVLYFTPSAVHTEPAHNATIKALCVDDRMCFVCEQESVSVHDNSSFWNAIESDVFDMKQWGSVGDTVAQKCLLQCCSLRLSESSGLNSLALNRSSFDIHLMDHFTFMNSTYSVGQKCRNFTDMSLLKTNLTFDLKSETVCRSSWIGDTRHLMANSSGDNGTPKSRQFYDSCTLNCAGSEELVPTDNIQATGSQYGATFWIFFVVFLLVIFAINPAFSILDSICYSALRDRGGEYGKTRLWGTISLGIFAPISGFVMDAIGRSWPDKLYLFPFVACSVAFFITAITSYYCPSDEAPAPPSPAQEALKSEEESSPETLTFLKKVKLLLLNPEIVAVFTSVTLSGLVTGCHDMFFSWFLKNLGADQLVIGMCVLAMSVSEIILLFTSGSIVSLLGYRVCLYVTFIVYGTRFLVNSFMVSPWLAVGTEATQSICFGLLLPAASLAINGMAPPGMHGTIQGIIGALHFSVGRAIGAAIAGVMFELYGPRRMFQIIAGISFSYALLLAVALETTRLVKRKTGKTGQAKKTELPAGESLELRKKNLNNVEDASNNNTRNHVTADSQNDESSKPMLP